MPKPNPTDLRELVMRAMWPQGVPPDDYKKVIDLVTTVSVHALSRGKLSARRRLSREDLSAEVLRALGSGPKSTTELCRLTGSGRRTVYLAAKAAGAKLSGRGPRARWKA